MKTLALLPLCIPALFAGKPAVSCDSLAARSCWLRLDWVEKGNAPVQLLGAHVEHGNTRTRPLCPYPQVARYKGSGSIGKAESFSCFSLP
jgi:hypothetical protein